MVKRVIIARLLLLTSSLLVTVLSVAFVSSGIEGMPGILKRLCSAIVMWYLRFGLAPLILGVVGLVLARHVTHCLLLTVNSIILLASIIFFVFAAISVPAACSMGALTWLLTIPAASFRVLILFPLTIIVVIRPAVAWQSKLALVLTLVLGIAADIGVAAICFAVHGL